MMEDLYTGKTTIRQIRRSHMSADGGFEVREIYEGLKKAGLPELVERGANCIILPSAAFCRYIMDRYGGLFHYHNLYLQLQSMFQPYCSMFAITMIIND